MLTALACLVSAPAYPAEVLRIVDGDTVELRLDLGFGIQLRDKARLWGINAPERNAVGGTAATGHLAILIPPGSTATAQPKDGGRDKYGRLLLVLFDGQCRDVNRQMVADGHAEVMP
jgi:micrococcal nuclease